MTEQQNPPDQKQQMQSEQDHICHRMCQIKHKILVLSGKGDVGKSTVAAGSSI